MRNARFAALAASLLLLGFASSAFAQGRSPYPEGSIFMAPRSANTDHMSGTGAAKRSASLSPLNPLDAPDAGNVWKPSNRDAGNFTDERWAAYAARRQDIAAAPPADTRPQKSDPAHRYPSYDSFADFFAHVFH
jgi:hypothetical protein